MAETFRTPEISYTSRDFESIRDDLIRAIQFFVPEWTNQNESDFGIAILELFSYAMDVLHFYIDREMLEGFLKTALKRESVRMLLALIDYRLGTAIPSSVDLLFTLPEVFAVDITIPEGTQVQTSSDSATGTVFFETISELIIPAGFVTGTIGAIEGVITEDTIGTSNGGDLQRFEIPFDNVVEESIRIIIDEGSGDVEWAKASGNTLILAEALDLAYFTEREGTPGRPIINFGDNIAGKIPSPASDIEAIFRVLTTDRGGVNGNVGARTILTIEDPITSLGDPVSVTVTNELSASGGEPPESLEEAKIKGPQSLNALNRAVNEKDYKTLAEIFPGVELASSYTIEDQSSFCCAVCVVIYPEGGGTASSVLKEALALCFENKKMAGTIVQIKDACEKKINIEGTIYIRDSFTQQQVSECVTKEINNFFEIGNGPLIIGRNVNLSDIYPAVMNCFNNGVSYLNITKLTIQAEAELQVWSGNTVFQSISQKKKSQTEKWTIVFNSGTTFTVTGSLSGLQNNTGTTGVDYITDDSDLLAFKIISDPNVASPKQNKAGDIATFDTSPILGNAEIPRDCVAIKGSVQFQFIGGTIITLNCE